MNLIERAVAYAAEAHEGQSRKGASGLAYTHHLPEVAALVGAFGGSEAAIAAAWLHDAVEDTAATIGDVRERFGDEVAGYVAELTDDPALDTEARRAAQIASAPGKSPAAALIKTADQTSNLRGFVASPPGRDAGRRERYIAKARAVVAGPTIPDGLRAAFDRAAAAARG
jgi:(p)ppGpp synthase/HD superfamily hydrolase